MKQKLVVGARVVHKQFGEGVIVEVDGDYPDLAPFIKAQSCLDNKMWWCYADSLTLATPVLEQPKTESQQLVDILVQLGFENRYDEDYPYYNYYSKKLNVYWNDFDRVYNRVYNLEGFKNYIPKVYNESLATNIAYFQKKLNKKLKKATAKQACAASVEPVGKPHDVVITKVEKELVNSC